MNSSLSDVVNIGYMTFGVIVSFVLDPAVTWLRTSYDKRKKRATPDWVAKYKSDFKLGIATLVISVLIAFVVVYGFGIRPPDPSQAFQLGFIWNAFIDKMTGKAAFSYAK